MNMLTSRIETMTSQQIADLLEKRHDSVKRTIERLAEKDVVRFTPSVETSHEGAGARPVEVYLVNERDSYVVVAQLSPEFTARLVDYWRAHKNQPPQIPTTAEAFAQAFRMLADTEARDAQREQRLNLMDARLERVEETAPLTAKPQNTETLSDVRARINRKYGLPPRIVDFVLMKITYHIRPFGMVKNSHENAQGSSFAVYHSIDVTKLFKRFVGECSLVTATMATHPEIDGRFKLIRSDP